MKSLTLNLNRDEDAIDVNAVYCVNALFVNFEVDLYARQSIKRLHSQRLTQICNQLST